LAAGVPVLIVTAADGEVRIRPADIAELRVPTDSDQIRSGTATTKRAAVLDLPEQDQSGGPISR
jgi:hypothetical protein